MDLVALLALSAAFLFGLGLILTHFGLRSLTPLQGAVIGIPAAAAVSAVLAPLLVDFTAATFQATAIFMAIGCLFPIVVTLLAFEANRRIGPNLTGALGNLAPLFAVAIAFVMLGDAPDANQSSGLAIIFAGLVVLLWRPGRSAAGLTLTAIALPLGAALVRGLVQPLVKLGLESWPEPIAAAAIGYAVSTVLVIILNTVRPSGAGAALRRPAALWFVAVGFCNATAVLLMYAALARGPVTTVAPLVAAYPLAAVLLSWILLRAPVDRRTLAGIAITVAGVALMLRG